MSNYNTMNTNNEDVIAAVAKSFNPFNNSVEDKTEKIREDTKKIDDNFICYWSDWHINIDK